MQPISLPNSQTQSLRTTYFRRHIAVRLASHHVMMMNRPCFLVIDNQYPGTISTRKLVIETAQLNVLTAYSVQEALALFARFPDINGIVFDTEIAGTPCPKFIEKLRAIRNDIPIVTVSPTGEDKCDGEQYHVSSYDPQTLLDQLRHICGKEKQAIRENEASRE